MRTGPLLCFEMYLTSEAGRSIDLTDPTDDVKFRYTEVSIRVCVPGFAPGPPSFSAALKVGPDKQIPATLATSSNAC